MSIYYLKKYAETNTETEAMINYRDLKNPQAHSGETLVESFLAFIFAAGAFAAWFVVGVVLCA